MITADQFTATGFLVLILAVYWTMLWKIKRPVSQWLFYDVLYLLLSTGLLLVVIGANYKSS